MTNMRDEICQIISDNYQFGNKSLIETADAILAALPDMIAPLVWEDNSAYSVLGVYNIEEYKNLCFSWGLNEDDLWTYGTEADTLDAAQSAANTHHRASIMAAFTGATSK